MINNTKKHTDQIEQSQTHWVQSKTKKPTLNIIFSEQCEREYFEYEYLLEMYSVHCFSILRGGKNKTNCYEVISPLYAIRESALTFLAHANANYPDSQIYHWEFYFTSEYDEGRQELLLKIEAQT